jgi:hypothetical protein
MTLKINKVEGPAFVTDKEQLDQYLAAKSRDKLVLAGQLLMCSLEPLSGVPDFVSRQPRAVAKPRPWVRKTGPARALSVLLDKQALSSLARVRAKPVFAVDALLKYGLKLKGADEYMVLAAFEGVQSAQLLALAFRKGELASYDEFNLPNPNAHSYSGDLHVLLDRLRTAHPNAVTHWCGPLAMPAAQTFVVAPKTFWQPAPVVLLSVNLNRGVVSLQVCGLVLVAITAAGSAGAVYMPYLAYQEARAALAHESRELKGQLTFDSDRLALLRARSAFFESTKDGDAKLVALENVLTGLQLEKGLVLKEARLSSAMEGSKTGQPRGGKPADFEVEVLVPRTAGVSALDQAKPLLESLSARTGANMRLAVGMDAYADQKAAGKGDDLRRYKIQGDFPRAS